MPDEKPVGERKKLHRCQHCDNKACPAVGMRRIVEGGCEKYIPLDPALRPRKWVGARRIRKQCCITISERNLDFIREKLVHMHRKKICGYDSRAVVYCVETVLEKLCGAMPRVLDDYDGKDRSKKIQFIMLIPEHLFDKMNAIVEYWKTAENGNHRLSRSRFVDYCITTVRKAMEGK